MEDFVRSLFGKQKKHNDWAKYVGLAALGLAAYTTYSMLPDIKRYLKIKRM